MAKNTRKSIISRRYAKALFAQASGDAARNSAESDLAKLAEIVGGSEELEKTFANPINSKESLSDVAEALCKKAKVGKLVATFCQVLAENRRLQIIPEISEAFSQLSAAARGELKVQVTTAHELKPAQAKKLTEKLSKATKQKISLQQETNQALLGGLTLRMGSVMLDSSIAGRLNRLGSYLKNKNVA